MLKHDTDQSEENCGFIAPFPIMDCKITLGYPQDLITKKIHLRGGNTPRMRWHTCTPRDNAPTSMFLGGTVGGNKRT